jgi:hypothetical protein
MGESDEVGGQPEEFGLTEQPARDITRDREPAPAEGDHDHDHGHDHQTMKFSMFKRTPEGNIVEIQAEDIERDTSGYDEEGRDPGYGPARPAPPDPPAPSDPDEHEHHPHH